MERQTLDIWEEWCDECANTDTPCIHTLEKIEGGAE